MLVDFVFHRSLAARRGGGARGDRRAARRSGFPDADRALPGGRPADPRPGRDRLGPPARRRAHRAGGRPGRGEPVGAGPLPDGGPARDRGRASPRVAEASAQLRRRGRRARGAACSSPATSRPWRRSTRPTRRSCTGSTSAASTIGRAGASGCRTSISPTRSCAASSRSRPDGAEITAQDLPTSRAGGAPGARHDRARRRTRSCCSSSGARVVGARPGERAAGDALAPARGGHGRGLARRATWRRGSGSASLLELFALDVLPIGAVRYPDYGPATVAAAALAAGAPWELGLGLSVGARRWCSRCSAAGACRSVRRLERARRSSAAPPRSPPARAARSGGCSTPGCSRDAARGALLTVLGLAGAWALGALGRARPRDRGRPHAGGHRRRALGGGRRRGAERGPRRPAQVARRPALVVGTLLAVLR